MAYPTFHLYGGFAIFRHSNDNPPRKMTTYNVSTLRRWRDYLSGVDCALRDNTAARVTTRHHRVEGTPETSAARIRVSILAASSWLASPVRTAAAIARAPGSASDVD